MSISFLAKNEMPKFKLANINDATYWRHVKRMVARELNFKKVDGTVMHSISRTFERNGGIHGKLPSPFYDALCLVLRKPRQGLQHEAFFAKYPSVVEIESISNIIELRNTGFFLILGLGNSDRVTKLFYYQFMKNKDIRICGRKAYNLHGSCYGPRILMRIMDL